MGFTPLEGLVMGTRCGDIDPAIVPFLQHKEKLNHKKVDELLNKKSGLFGLCGKTDMRDIHKALEQGDKSARLAHEVFCYRLTKYLGAYIAAMNGVDAIVFTGGIGENAWWVRDEVLQNFSQIGLRVNKKANRQNMTKISSFTSRVWVFVIPTNEELMMARETRKVLEKI
jgi:acetate kinase